MTSVAEMVAAARARITNLSQTDFERERAGGEAVLIDVRDVRERWRDGTIPGARHVPRGMIEFWADPESKYHKDYLSPERRVILFCAAGMRSALAGAALRDLGYTNVAHLDTGLVGWKQAGGEVEAVPRPPVADAE